MGTEAALLVLAREDRHDNQPLKMIESDIDQKSIIDVRYS